jgi:hypothetical protein
MELIIEIALGVVLGYFILQAVWFVIAWILYWIE